MRATRTQFDNQTFPGAIATPTCGACCCCCCCCLVATAASGKLVGRKIDVSPQKKTNNGLKVLAYMAVPIALIASVASLLLIDNFPVINSSATAFFMILFIPLLVILGIYFFINARIKSSNPGVEALRLGSLIVGISILEVMIGVWLLNIGVSPIMYVVLSILPVILIIRWSPTSPKNNDDLE